MRQKLIEKIQNNEKLLEVLKQKKKNLEEQIKILERKLENQKHALNNIPPLTEEEEIAGEK